MILFVKLLYYEPNSCCYLIKQHKKISLVRKKKYNMLVCQTGQLFNYIYGRELWIRSHF